MSNVDNILDEYLEFFNQNQIDLKNKFLIGVSGGIDSMAVLDLSIRRGLKVSVAHVNYGLRDKENILEKKIVEKYCAANNIDFFYKEAYINRSENLQNEARNIRYDFFNEIIDQQNIDYLITAHQQNDNHESFLYHFFRGNGINRLKGIAEMNGNILRPLLRFKKSQLKEYVEEHQISYSLDSSNSSSKYDRNFIRNELFEKVGERFPKYEKGLSKSIKFLSEDYLLLNLLIKDVLKDLIEVQEDQIKISPKDSISGLVWSHYFRKFGFNHFQIEKWVKTKHQSGKYIESEYYQLLYDRGNWVLYRKDLNEKDSKIFYLKKNASINNPIHLNGHVIKQFTIEKLKTNVESFDVSKLHFPLKLRKWEHGDFIQPLGMSGLKKVSDVLIDKKVALNDKKNTWVLLSENEIIWVIGYIISEKYKINKSSKQFYKIELKNKND
jgi:tRNA(Ile)-lysidine synthase